VLSRHAQRGQTFPVWVFGTLTVLTLLAFSVNYGNSLYWQLRAQNAADAAAQGALSIQATRWNAMLSDLHAATVEEYRLRYLARDLALLSSTNASTWTYCAPGNNGVNSCSRMYSHLASQYIASANRYTQDVQTMQALSAPTFATDQTDVSAAVANLQRNCAQSTGGDCGFDYTVVNPKARTTALSDVVSDCCGSTVGGGLRSPASLNASLNPMEIEVVACANVTPLFPSALSWVTAPTFTAIGRAAATTIMATQEFMELGAMQNPLSGNVFQPTEFPETTDTGIGQGPSETTDNDQYLRIDYGGNQTCTYGNCGNPSIVTNPAAGAYQGVLTNEALDIYTGWWTTVAVAPYSGPISSGTYSCK
jgi:hypothetical protein